ncbi:hypothetical protein FACS189413_07600 [Bacteroidia bacterium]|nr:hypothetical protein FACS189413_07600 [Bacteroidia bacterium]
MGTMTKIKDISAALNLFEEVAIKHAEATKEGDYKTGNKNYHRKVKAVSWSWLWLPIVVFTIGYVRVVFIKNQYYIEEVNMYIKTFHSRETAIIAFSDKKINKFSDSLNYVIVRKGDNYYTNFFFDVKDKTVIYSRNNSIRDTHVIEYQIKTVLFSDTAYYVHKGNGSYLLKPLYTGISVDFWGATERVSLKNREDVSYTVIKPIGK